MEAHRRPGAQEDPLYLHVPVLHADLRSDLGRGARRQGRVASDPSRHRLLQLLHRELRTAMKLKNRLIQFYQAV